MAIRYLCDTCRTSDVVLYRPNERHNLRVTSEGQWRCRECWDEDYDGDWDDAPIPPLYCGECQDDTDRAPESPQEALEQLVRALRDARWIAGCVIGG